MRRKSRPGELSSRSSTIASAERIARRRSSPGVLMMSYKLELLYMNKEALSFNEQLAKADHPASKGRGLIPPAIMSFCEEILTQVKLKSDLKEWEHFQVLRVENVSPSPILLRGIGIQSSRTLLILAENLSDGHRNGVSIQSNDKLSDRERAVVTYLATGMTNKQIAQQLGLSEHTVKDHVKRAMYKTKTHTRTELVTKVAFPTAQKINGKAIPTLQSVAPLEEVSA